MQFLNKKHSNVKQGQKMRVHLLTGLSIVFTVFFLVASMPNVYGQTYIQYKIQINIDGSASWRITQVTDVNGTLDSWNGFQERIASLINATANLTGREMWLDADSLELSTFISTNQSKTVEYQFAWHNFGIIQPGQITFGDVFQLDNFFDQLYGDGGLRINYPPNFSVLSVFPTPDLSDNSSRTLEWLGTQFFVSETPIITVASVSNTPSPSPTASPNQPAANNDWQLYAIVGAVAAVTTAALIAVFYRARRKKNKANETTQTTILKDASGTESEEQKIIKIIQANGGSTYQSAITEQTRFSKAKTSQLLTALEQKSVVTRYKKGRDKIVTLSDPKKGEKS
jgi:uncharacterized membrane protein